MKQVIDAPSGYEGEGFPVRRAFAGVDLRDLDPFVHMDQMGEVEYAPGEPKGTPWHPHRGFETVTYIIDGVFDHQDSHGGGGTITNGDTQWMTAGCGLLHIEAPPEWLVQSGRPVPRHPALGEPAARREVERPDVPGHPGRPGRPGRLVRRRRAGPGDRRRGRRVTRAPGSTYTPMAMVHATVEPGARLDLPWDASSSTRWSTCSAGRAPSAIDGTPVRTGNLAVLGAGDFVTVAADGSQDSRTPALDVLVVGGQPIREPIAWAGPFVMNTRAEVRRRRSRTSRRAGSAPSPPCTVRRRTCRRAEHRTCEQGRADVPRPSRLHWGE